MEGEAGEAGRTRHVSLVRGLGFMSGVRGPAEGILASNMFVCLMKT